MDAFLHGVPAGLVSFTDDGTLLTVNRTFATLLGRAPESLVGQRIDGVFNVAGRVFFQTHLFPLLKMSGRIEEAHVAMMDALGNEVPIVLNAVRHEREGSLVCDAVIVPMRRRLQYESEILDTKRRLEAANAELHALKGDLERRVAERTRELLDANEEMEGFTYSIAHDLRTPLRAIASTSHILLEEASEDLSAEHQELLHRQAVNAVKLGRLMDALLKFSRLSRSEFVRTPIDLTSLAREVVSELEAGRASGRCEFHIQPEMNANGDPRLVRLVLSNLLENACKFSPDGGRVWIRDEETAHETVFSVRDEGVGFDMRYVHKLFLPFNRLVADHEFPGTGIGLANVQRIVQRHGGRAWAESSPGQGATFFFTLAPPAAA